MLFPRQTVWRPNTWGEKETETNNPPKNISSLQIGSYQTPMGTWPGRGPITQQHQKGLNVHDILLNELMHTPIPTTLICAHNIGAVVLVNDTRTHCTTWSASL